MKLNEPPQEIEIEQPDALDKKQLRHFLQVIAVRYMSQTDI